MFKATSRLQGRKRDVFINAKDMEFYAKFLTLALAVIWSAAFVRGAELSPTADSRTLASELCAVMDFDFPENFAISRAVAQEIESRAAKGDFDANAALGVCYYAGLNFPKDRQKAVEKFTVAAFGGSEFGMWGLGLSMIEGSGVAINEKSGVGFLRKSAAKNFAPAINQLGVCYYRGIGVGRNFPKAVELFRRAEALGSNRAKVALARAFLEGAGVKKNPLEARRLLEEAAKAGNAVAQNNPCRILS